MNRKIKEKIKEAFSAVLPISFIVLMISTILVPLSLGIVAVFVVGAILLVVGMGFFTLGADMAMMIIGEGVGVQFTKSKRMWLIVFICFLLGFIVTVAEPDLRVLAAQVQSIPDMTLIITIAAGVGIFLVIALFRVILKVSLSRILIILYAAIFILSIFTPSNFIAAAFDSGGVTTGPITVPFILALGVGLASLRVDKESEEDSFGFVALCSVGPILSVMILGILTNPQDVGHAAEVVPEVDTLRDVFTLFAAAIPDSLRKVMTAMLPIIVFFILFQLASKRFRKGQMARIVMGIVYSIIGLVLFFTGVETGFIPDGNIIGKTIAGTANDWLLIPIGILIGYFIVAAEPAVHVLNEQVEEVSGGAIPKKAMKICLSVGMAVSMGLAMIRILTGISIYWFLAPGYAAALLLTFRVPKIFTAIAFDSGGVASGPMTSTFLLPFAIGACEAEGGNIMTDAFGIVAMVAMTPLIAIQLMGFIYTIKMKKQSKKPNLDMDGLIEILEQVENSSKEDLGGWNE